jgi:uroporphyrin-III C-methyltransferase
VVVYMGVSTAPMIASRLIAAGRACATPVVVVENASRGEERRVLATLGTLPDAVSGLEGPAVLIIGEVAAMTDISAHPRESGGRGPDSQMQRLDLGPRFRGDERVKG